MSEIEWLDVFGDNLREMLQEAKMTQSDLACEADLSVSNISRYIGKQQLPSLKAIINISYALGCNVSDLIDFGEKID